MRRWFFICLLLPLAGCKPGADKDDKAPPEQKKEPAAYAVERNAAGETLVCLTPETQERIGLKVATLEAARQQPAWTAFGSVLDPSPLIVLQGDIAAAQTALDAAHKVTQRAKALFAQDENVSRKTLDAAENEERAGQIKLQTAQRNLELDWGSAIAALDAAARQTLVDQLAARQTVLLQVDLPIGETIAGQPAAVRVTVVGRDHEYPAAFVSPASKADPKTQGQGFLLRIDHADAALAPGAAVAARLGIPGPAQSGVALPDSAIVRFNGKTWIYLAGTDNKFTRREVTLDSPLEQGWFTTNGCAPGDRAVVQAAQLLLSEEQKAQIQAD
ncbi:MAG: hypothetical protein ABSH38_12095 [Verrucomicrobiota bacterium]|jgi:hypothetical protein